MGANKISIKIEDLLQLQFHCNCRKLTDNMVNGVRVDDGYIYQIQ